MFLSSFLPYLISAIRYGKKNTRKGILVWRVHCVIIHSPAHRKHIYACIYLTEYNECHHHLSSLSFYVTTRSLDILNWAKMRSQLCCCLAYFLFCIFHAAVLYGNAWTNSHFFYLLLFFDFLTVYYEL